jgi:hypothetical protein
MPQNPVLVYELATGEPTWMSSVDVAEAMALGDYSLTPVVGLEPTTDAIADALAIARGVDVPL